MAGAGFKTFNTGDVLTASDVNTYLMQQTVMVFADSSARTTALGANVAEGMISYLKDTNAVEVYNGSAWVSSDDPNAIQNTIVDAKGDIITATAADTPARLAVGSSGNLLVADSSAATGLAYSPTFFAGKNACINGDFRINQRAFSTTTTNNVYTFDRWVTNINGTGTISAQTFTAGTAPVTGYEAINFIRLAASSQGSGNYVSINQRIEDVRVFADQTFTVSFWAKASSGTPKVSAYIGQSFGSGGSAAVYTYGSAPTTTTSWARYSITITAPSISGKTIGTGSYLDLGIEVSDSFNSNLGAQNATIDIWGVQAEAGSTATQFQTATGTLQGELAAAQRYYYRHASGLDTAIMSAGAYDSTVVGGVVKFATSMRTAPTLTVPNTAGYFKFYRNGGNVSAATLSLQEATTNSATIYGTFGASTAGHSGWVTCANASSYIDFGAEL